MTHNQIDVEVEVYPVISNAMAHNEISPVQFVALRNNAESLTGLEISAVLRDGQGDLSEPFTVYTDLGQNAIVKLTELPIRLRADSMNQVEESRPGQLEINLVHEGESLGRITKTVRILATRQWQWEPPGLALELLAAHVMPNAPEVTSLLSAASDRLKVLTGQSRVDGYQSGAERVDFIVRAIYEALVAWRIRYSEPPASWTDKGQKIRTPADIHDTRFGTCIDMTLLFAAALEQAGIRPLVWMFREHSVVGWWRQELDNWAAANFDVPEMSNRLAIGQVGVLETTLATDRDEDVTFQEASVSALQRIRDEQESVVGVLDVWSARRSRILPLPAISRSSDGETQTFIYKPKEHSISPTERRSTEVESEKRFTKQGIPVPARVQKWKNSLLDLSLRNRLINFNPRAAVKLNVPPEHLSVFEDLVAIGKTINLAATDSFDDVYRHRDGIQRASDLPAEILHETLTEKYTVFTDLNKHNYLTRLLNLAYKARTVEEETGANNLYLALGTLVWEFDGRELRSPLVLIPLHLKASRGRRAAYRIVGDDTGTSTPNYSLLEKLRLTFGISFPALDDTAADGNVINISTVLRTVRETLVERGLPFWVEETAEISMLQFAKYRLWKDLDDNWESLLEQPLVQHLAFTPTAEFSDPIKANEEYDLEQLGLQCPIPADGSQLTAIADAMEGRTFVLEGPPGTGKSQTIANMLARGIAEGKRILFVAEKRVALDVVARRVREIGLGPFLLDP